ncbi:hypothetical protein MED121_00020 [Marinomonas sp. MED121]|uniref:flagellar brake protein n=1 Tax=Marinomonas sp. MED121 TaxID=314277 RepID=UPI0000690154|nr:flagellar brake protein [Marinomonas sp. MED121]EAQ63284.1 hypothetical protein MED121_00020 [Marinomonas sp. MED121]
MAEVEQVGLDDLEISLGANLQLEFIPSSARHTVKIIGHVPRRSLIVSCPMVNGKNILVRDNQIVMARLMLDTAVCAFSTKVAKSYLEPLPHLHLSYPEFVETSVVRQSVRVETRLISAVEPLNDPESIESIDSGFLVDLSLGGCRLISKNDFGHEGNVLNLALNLNVAGFNQVLKIRCEIRTQEVQMREQVESSLQDNAFISKMESDFLYVYGFKFTDITKEKKILLTAYILEKRLMQKH